MTEIPVVDFGAFLYGRENDKKRIAKEIDDAFCRVGFVYLNNHGVEKEMVKECFSWSKKFFCLPLETKMLAPHPPGGSHHRGYSAPGVEKVSQGVYDTNELNRLREVSSLDYQCSEYMLIRSRHLTTKSPSNQAISMTKHSQISGFQKTSFLASARLWKRTSLNAPV
jgi:isopenicillin N synthase-like dioxygenase